MTVRKAYVTSLAAVLVGLGVLAAHPAQAQGYRRVTRTTTVTHYTYAAPLTGGQREAQRLHREAVRLDHQATYEDQHGHPERGTQLARQASHLNAMAFRLGSR